MNTQINCETSVINLEGIDNGNRTGGFKMNVSKVGNIMPAFLFCLSIIVGFSVYAADNKYTMEYLRLLDKQESY